MTKVEFSITNREAELLTVRAAQLGYSLTTYIKLLASQEASKTIGAQSVPVFRLSSKAEARALKAARDHRAGNTVCFDSFVDLTA